VVVGVKGGGAKVDHADGGAGRQALAHPAGAGWQDTPAIRNAAAGRRGGKGHSGEAWGGRLPEGAGGWRQGGYARGRGAAPRRQRAHLLLPPEPSLAISLDRIRMFSV
jgi:hypothetical protein